MIVSRYHFHSDYKLLIESLCFLTKVAVVNQNPFSCPIKPLIQLMLHASSLKLDK